MGEELLLGLNFKQRLEAISEIYDIEERINQLALMNQDLSNQFVFEIGIIDCEIENALQEAPEDVIERNGWYHIEDVTQKLQIG